MSLPIRAALFAAFCLLATGANHALASLLWERSQNDNTASHIVLIPLVAVGLAVMNRQAIFTSVATWWRGGFPVIALGAVLMFVWPAAGLQPNQDLALTLATVPLLVLWTGGFLLLFGAATGRRALFPLAFLWLTAPFPAVLLTPVNDFLKWGSAEVVALLFKVTGTPHVREAYVFQLPFVSIRVADECSGIRSSIGLMITALIAGYMFIESPSRRLMLVLIAIPITIFKNGTRIAILSLLSIYVDPTYLTGQLHHEGGLVFFTISLLLMTPPFLYLVLSERRKTAPGVRTATA